MSEYPRNCWTCVFRYVEEPDPCLDCFDANNDDGTRKNWKGEPDLIERHKQLSDHDRETIERTLGAIFKKALTQSSQTQMEGDKK